MSDALSSALERLHAERDEKVHSQELERAERVAARIGLLEKMKTEQIERMCAEYGRLRADLICFGAVKQWPASLSKHKAVRLGVFLFVSLLLFV